MIPLYNLKTVRLQSLLGSVILSFFVINTIKVVIIPNWTAYAVMAILCGLLVLILKKLMHQKKHTRVYLMANDRGRIDLNWTKQLPDWSLLTAITVIHLCLVHHFKSNFFAVTLDYALGGSVALGLKIYFAKKRKFMWCDHGLAFGSRFDSKLIEKKHISHVEVDSKKREIFIFFDKNFSLQKVKFSPGEEIFIWQKLIAQEPGITMHQIRN